jgi:hypothetical protein
MTKDDFSRLFSAALEEAAREAEKRFDRGIPRKFQILLHGAGHGGDRMKIQDALDAIYIDEERFHVVIDVAITEVSNTTATALVRVSAHAPVPFERTWNQPPGSGPFKTMVAQELKRIAE